MAKAVGLSRKITLKWLNKAHEFFSEGLTEEEFKTQMNDYLSFEIDSPTVLRKTREILMHVWFYEDDYYLTLIRRDADDLLKRYPEYDIAIHWCMLLSVYPVFADICKLIGRISDFTDIVTLSQLKQNLYDEWGERSTLYHSTDKIIATMKELDAISSEKPGKYTIKKHSIARSEVALFMAMVAMKVDGNSYYSFSELHDFDLLFPFEYKTSKEELMTNERFTVSTFGGEVSVSLSVSE